jgi:hypothetical protein
LDSKDAPERILAQYCDKKWRIIVVPSKYKPPGVCLLNSIWGTGEGGLQAKKELNRTLTITRLYTPECCGITMPLNGADAKYCTFCTFFLLLEPHATVTKITVACEIRIPIPGLGQTHDCDEEVVTTGKTATVMELHTVEPDVQTKILQNENLMREGSLCASRWSVPGTLGW